VKTFSWSDRTVRQLLVFDFLEVPLTESEILLLLPPT
jgi:hypothetical protein